MEKYRALFHVDEAQGARFNLVLNNINNLIMDLGVDNCEIALVANGEGIMALLETPNTHQEQLTELKGKGVRFLACANSLHHLGLKQEALLDLVEIIPAGVTELVKKQAEGWAYIRP